MTRVGRPVGWNDRLPGEKIHEGRQRADGGEYNGETRPHRAWGNDGPANEFIETIFHPVLPKRELLSLGTLIGLLLHDLLETKCHVAYDHVDLSVESIVTGAETCHLSVHVSETDPILAAVPRRHPP